MIQRVSSVTIFVRDLDRACSFYTDVLGMEKRADALVGEAQTRWITVAPPGSDTEIVLYVPDEAWVHFEATIGQPQPITLDVNDLDRVGETLRNRGVEFLQGPTRESWGAFAVIADSERNQIMLVQR